MSKHPGRLILGTIKDWAVCDVFLSKHDYVLGWYGSKREAMKHINETDHDLLVFQSTGNHLEYRDNIKPSIKEQL